MLFGFVESVTSSFSGVCPDSYGGLHSQTGLFPVSPACSKWPYTHPQITDLKLMGHVFQLGEWEGLLSGRWLHQLFSFEPT